MEGVESNYFDGAYAIEATCHAPELAEVYRQAYRVLKPGGMFATYEWITTDAYDPSDPAHKKAIADIEYGNGLPPLRDEAGVLAAAEQVGFHLVSSLDLVTLEKGNEDSTLPWEYRISSILSSAWTTQLMVYVTETLGLAPEGSADTHEMLVHALDGLVAGAQQRIFTPMHLFVFRKPEAPTSSQM